MFEEFLGLKPKMYLFFVVVNSEQKKAKGLNRNVVPTMIYNECKYVLLNNKSIIHSMNGIKSKERRIGIYEIKKIHCLVLMAKYIYLYI